MRGAFNAPLCLQVRNDLHCGRLPPVQPFHAMAYPFSADLALAISSKYAQYCALTASCMRPPALTHPRVRAPTGQSAWGSDAELASVCIGMEDVQPALLLCAADACTECFCRAEGLCVSCRLRRWRQVSGCAWRMCPPTLETILCHTLWAPSLACMTGPGCAFPRTSSVCLRMFMTTLHAVCQTEGIL